ncbi:hypothetical protein PFISCL1PPCAC_26143, partial [Pristionchus fissidentatus]
SLLTHQKSKSVKEIDVRELWSTFRHKETSRDSVYGMWRLAAILLLSHAAAAAVFSEGGGKKVDKFTQQQQQLIDEDIARELELGEQLKQNYLDYLVRAEAEAAQEDEQREEQEKAVADEMLREAQMEAILQEMAKAQATYEQMEEDEKEMSPRDVASAPLEEEKIPVAPEVSQKKEEQPKQEEKIDESFDAQLPKTAPTAQKKGQNEFVSFVDPDASRLTKSVPSVDKRTIEQVRIQGANKGGHLLFLAVGCVMAVGMVAALIGGLIRYRKNREEPDDQEYAPYAGTGPRTKKPIKGEKGDDTLAYKAQLHHYQQAKQKIICGEENAGVAGDSDDETDEIDDENNFSVYECPGLAPTGDIEVHNPNFAADRP